MAIEGKVQHHGRFAFLLAERPGQEDLMLRGPSLRLAMDGDRVEARVTPGPEGRPVGEIVRVLERARLTVTGVLRKAGAGWVAVPEEADERDAIEVLGFSPGLAARAGEVVVVKITHWPTLSKSAGGQVCETIGRPGEPGVRLRAVLRTRDLPERFPDAVLAESQTFPDEVSAPMWAGRQDLRDLPVFTIDGADAKDFDDAVSLEVVNPTIMRLGVHIADVSHYVKKGTALDDEAAGRATSIYLADRVVPMLPPKLSDHLCSLRPDVERLTLSCFMDVDASGRVRASSLKETVIRSRRRFTYEEVEAVLEGRRVENVDAQVRETVLRMGTLWRAVHVLRMRRGALDMTVPEYAVKVDASGRPLEVVKRARLASHRLIEEFMLLANEEVARTLLHGRVPFLSRIHPDPDARKLEGLGAELKRMGVYAPGSLAQSPATAMQIVLKKAVGHPLEDTINMLVMRTLKQASYSHRPGGHFGLASKAYCHFTSPIRRYPDLVTHRAVKALIHKRVDEPLAAGLKELGAHCSERERVAADAERRSIDILRAELLARRVGQVFDGVVTGSAAFGLFVTLKDLGASGLARGASAPLGSRVRVKLDRVDEGKGELDLSLTGPNRPVVTVGRSPTTLGGGTSAPAAPPRGGRPSGKPEWKDRPGDKPRWKSSGKPDWKKSAGKPTGKPRWAGKPDWKKSSGKPSGKPGWKPSGKPGWKPGGKPSGKPPAWTGKFAKKPRRS